jgi:hypothetical protein
MFITKEQLQQYTSNVPEDTDTMQDVYCSAACDIVTDYLGYSPESTDYKEVLDGNGTKQLQLCAKPVTEVKSVKIDGMDCDVTAFTVQGRYLYRTDGAVFSDDERNIVVTYTAGYENVPGIIVMTALRIAGLLQTESGNNIGITSKTFGDEGSRTFYKTKFDDYLVPLEKYRIYEAS